MPHSQPVEQGQDIGPHKFTLARLLLVFKFTNSPYRLLLVFLLLQPLLNELEARCPQFTVEGRLRLVQLLDSWRDTFWGDTAEDLGQEGVLQGLVSCPALCWICLEESANEADPLPLKVF
jgi:hypothetical protein